MVTVSCTLATSPSLKVPSSFSVSSLLPDSWLRALLPALPPMAEDRVASGVISSSSSFSRVTVLPSTASTLSAMLSPPSVTLETLVLLCSAAATFM